MKQIIYLIQGFFVHIFVWIFNSLSIDKASSLGSFIGKKLLSFSKWNKIAKKNLKIVYPDLSEEREKEILNKMWNNIGRIAGEYVHLNKISKDSGKDDVNKRINIKGFENIVNAQKDGKSIVFVSAHMANWEVIRCMSKFIDNDVGCVYRTPNNPYVVKLLEKLRKNEDYILYTKNSEGVVKMIKDLRKGKHVAIIIDQWLSKGMVSNFLGQKTKSPFLYATLAKKYGVHIVPIRIKRIDEVCKFELTFDKEIDIKDEDSEKDIVQKVNDIISKYIHDVPEDWLWIHNRFKYFDKNEK